MNSYFIFKKKQHLADLVIYCVTIFKVKKLSEYLLNNIAPLESAICRQKPIVFFFFLAY